MNLYAESSAVLSWLLAEGRGGEMKLALSEAELVVASDLTLVECDRVLNRALTLGQLKEGEAANRSGLLRRAASHWALLSLTGETIERSRRPFPREPILTLDALHLAAAITARKMVPDLLFLSLDERLRRTARAVGLPVHPDRGKKWSIHEDRPAPARRGKSRKKSGPRVKRAR